MPRGTQSSQTSTGIVSHGAYVPLYRLPRSAIGGAWGTRPIAGERSVANYDEDTVTMAVEAARDCLRGVDRETVDGLYFASTTAPYHEKGSAALVAHALNLPRRVFTADFAQSLRSGTAALRAALAVVASGQARSVLVVASDSRLAYPRSNEEQLFGDAAAAVLIGRGGVAATVDAFHSHADEIHDMWRRDADTFVRTWEDRFRLDEGYVLNLREALTALMQEQGLTPKDLARIVLPSPDARSAASVARGLGFTPEQLQDPLISSVGACGAAHALLLLVAALEGAEAGGRLLLGNYGDGADALLVSVADGVTQGDGGRGVKGHVASKRTLPSYERYAAYRGITPVAPEGALRVFQFSGASITWRERRSIISFRGSRCNQCGTTHFPLQRVCINCLSHDDYTEVPLAETRGQVFTYTKDNLAGGLNPPVIKAVVESEEGKARIDCMVTDIEPDEMRVELPVEMTFRRVHEGANMHNYFWKARPVRDGASAG